MPGGMPSGMPGGFPGGSGEMPPNLSGMMSDPEVAAAFQDPEVVAAFQDIGRNPANIANYQTNPKIMDVIQKLQAKMTGQK